MNRVQTVIDGVIVYDSGAVVPPNPVDPIIPPDPNPTPPPVGPYTTFELKLSGADVLRLPSGQVACATLPNVRANGGTTNSGQIIFGETTVSPRGASIEICISKTPGLIDPAAGAFYAKFPNTAFVKLPWLERLPPGWSEHTAAAYGIPLAYETQAPWYVNVRYTYEPGNCAYAPCGFVNQWNFESF